MLLTCYDSLQQCCSMSCSHSNALNIKTCYELLACPVCTSSITADTPLLAKLLLHAALVLCKVSLHSVLLASCQER
jgi:hypothetical protein